MTEDIRWLAMFVLVAVMFSIVAYIVMDKDDRNSK